MILMIREPEKLLEKKVIHVVTVTATSTLKNGKKLTLTWSKIEETDGYEILISSNKNFKKQRM